VTERVALPPAEPPALEDTGLPPRPRRGIVSGMLRRTRALHAPGTILVRPGDYVLPNTPVARIQPPGRLHLVAVAEALGVSPRRLSHYLRVDVGQAVEQGELLAERRGPLGLGQRQCYAPAAGVVTWVSATSGYLALSEPEPLREIRAHLGGQVIAASPETGVTIEGPALAVLGIAGRGGTVQGRLLLAVGRDTLPDQVSGAIVALTRPVTHYDVVHVAEMGAAGLLAPAVLPDAAGPLLDSIAQFVVRAGMEAGHSVPPPAPLPPGFCLVLTEGIGEIEMPAWMCTLLQRHADRVVSLTAEPPLPELLIPLDVIHDAPAPAELRLGAVVRLTSPSHLGLQATVVQTSALPRRLPAGLRTPAVLVQLPDESRQWHGLANLELAQE